MKIISFMLMFVLFTINVPIAKASEASILIRPTSFTHFGHWTSTNYADSLGEFTLVSSNYTASNLEAATANFSIATDGSYDVWFRTRDFFDNQPTTRRFISYINGGNLTNFSLEKDKSLDNPLSIVAPTIDATFFGTHGYEGYKWEKAPNVILTADDYALSIEGRSAFARVDAIIISNSPTFNPENYSYTQLMSECELLPSPLDEQAFLPEYAREMGTQVGNTLKLENSFVKLEFFKKTYGGKTYIQRKTTLDNIEVNRPTDGLGFMLLFADSTTPNANTEAPLIFRNTVDEQPIVTNDIFRSGKQVWFVPNEMELLPDGSVQMVASHDEFGQLRATWSLGAQSREPLVQLEYDIIKPGHYSLGMFNSPTEIERENVEYIQVPFRYQEMRIPTDPILISEAYSTAALSLMTVKSDVLGTKISYGVIPSNSVLTHGWKYQKGEYEVTPDKKVVDKTADQASFGLSIVGPGRDVMPGLFAPVFGTDRAFFENGSTLEYAYHPVTLIGDWYNLYSHCINNILETRDYRDNYYDSMTNTIFNMYNLMLDDYASGWTDRGKGHYNMEGRNIATVSDPQATIQLYLLTEDKEMLERRVIPTMEYMLSRPHFHYAYDDIAGSTDYFEASVFKNEPTGFNRLGAYDPASPSGAINIATSGYGNAVYAGAYLMSHGLMPIYRDITVSADRITSLSRPEILPPNGAIYNFGDLLWKHKIDGTANTYNRTLIHANNYVDYRVDVPQTQVVPDSNFIYIDFYPQFQQLLELYEVTNDIKHLTAARDAARNLIATLWAGPMPEDKDIVLGEETMDFAMARSGGATLFFRGDTRDRIGIIEEFTTNFIPSDLTENAFRETGEPVPEWVPSRVGLGVEQTSTYKGLMSNIIMSTWAGDLLRLSAQLDKNGMSDPNFTMFARNSIVGRYEDYPGYYFNQAMTFPNKKGFAYNGPDFTNIYFHHIPILLGALQDFLFAQAFQRSDGKIDFKHVRNQGYAWFNNRHFGAETGEIFDEKDMWPWLVEGLINVDNKQIDWLGGRKAGRAAFVLTNASNDTIITKVALGEKVGSTLSTTATIYDKDGGKTFAPIINGEISLTIPAKGLVSLALDSNIVKPPAYAAVPSDVLKDEPTSQTHVTAEIINDGFDNLYDINGHVIQMDPDNYYAFVYTNHKPDVVDSVTLEYDIGDGLKTITDEMFPFEFTQRVDNASRNFSFKVTLNMKDGSTQSMSEYKTLIPIYRSSAPSGQDIELETSLLMKDGFSQSSIKTAGEYQFVARAKNNTTTDYTPKVILGLYRGDKLVKILGIFEHTLDRNQTKDLTCDFTMEQDGSNMYLRAFVLNSTDLITPLTESVTFR